MYAAVSAACMDELAACHLSCGYQEVSPYQVVELDGGNTLVDT
jgi:hypothetical protein